MPSTELDRLTRWMVYQHFVQSGAAPPLDRLARLVEAPVPEVGAALERLAAERQLVLRDGAILMAPPFGDFESGLRVEARGVTYRAPCAWDALAIAALLESDAVIEADPLVGRGTIRLEVRDGTLLPTTTAIHFVVPAADFWADITFT